MSHRNLNLWPLLRNRRSRNNRLHSIWQHPVEQLMPPIDSACFLQFPLFSVVFQAPGLNCHFSMVSCSFYWRQIFLWVNIPNYTGRQNVDNRLSVERRCIPVPLHSLCHLLGLHRHLSFPFYCSSVQVLFESIEL